MYQLITIDLDDTLLRDDGAISQENKAAIRKAQEAGVRVVAASGRSYASSKQYIKELGLTSFSVSLNGAYIHDPSDGRTVEGFLIEKGIMQEMIRDIEPYHVHMNFSSGEHVYCEGPSEEALIYSQMNRIEMDYVDSLLELSKSIQAGKFLMSAEHETLELIKEALLEKYADKVNIAFSKPFFLEITDKNASKGSAMMKVAEMYGIDPKEVMAIGDSENDLSMIQKAGLGVAVANADEKIKKEAGFVTLSNNDNGVAYAINKFIFEEHQRQEEK